MRTATLTAACVATTMMFASVSAQPTPGRTYRLEATPQTAEGDLRRVALSVRRGGKLDSNAVA